MPKARCNVEGCSRPAWARGLCHGHLKRARRHKQVDDTLRTYSSPMEALWEAALHLADLPASDRRAWLSAKARAPRA